MDGPLVLIAVIAAIAIGWCCFLPFVDICCRFCYKQFFAPSQAIQNAEVTVSEDSAVTVTRVVVTSAPSPQGMTVDAEGMPVSGVSETVAIDVGACAAEEDQTADHALPQAKQIFCHPSTAVAGAPAEEESKDACELHTGGARDGDGFAGMETASAERLPTCAVAPSSPRLSHPRRFRFGFRGRR